MEKIKIVLTDVDGTLLNKDNVLTSKNKEAIKKLKKHNILFGIATGRPVESIEGLLPDWGIEDSVDIILGFNGALVKDNTLNKDFKSDLVDGKDIAQILRDYACLDSGFGIFEGRKLYVNKDSEYTRLIANRNKFELVVCDLVSRFEDSAVYKMLAINDKEKTDEVTDFYNNHLSDHYKGVRTGPFLFEFMNPFISKCHGIESVAKAHGWTIENVCVFGDEMNDYEMIRDCGLGIAMGNGNDKVKEVADFVTLSNNDDGIAYYLNHYIFKEDN